MKKLFIILALILLLSSSALASEINETKVSISMGHYTGTMGFLLERIKGYSAFYTGCGVTAESFQIVFGGHYYVPDHEARQTGTIRRSNVFIGPALCLSIESISANHGPDVSNSWAGMTAGYDFKWGRYDEYHLTLEGGIAISPFELSYTPVFNISMGYSY